VVAFAVAFSASSYWVSKNLLEHSSLYFHFRHGFAAAWAVSGSVGIVWWFAIRPLLHNLWTTLTAFVAGYVLCLAGCAMFAYSPKERTYVRDIGRRALHLPVDAQTAG
jgi:hypothetical protein